ncbi:MAG: prohibitin family protein [Balneolales bacterium]|nr:prohibitin family protein [Balneolales bacterium]
MSEIKTESDQQTSPEDLKPGSLSWFNYHVRSNKKGIIIALLAFLFVVVLFADRIVIFVNAGEGGVLFKRFGNGTVLERVYGEGIHYILPWDEMAIYNVRIQHQKREIEVLSSNGLKIQVTASIRYRPIYGNLPDLHQQVGPDYAERVVFPEVEAVIRQIFGQYLPEDIYSSQKFIIQNTVQNAIFEVSERFVELDELLITRIQLPELIVDAIEQKLEKEQVALGYQFRIDSEILEAERKRIEAEGIRDFQNIISEGITENYLRFRGIEATLKLSESNNAKVVVIGSGRDGLPIILDGTGSDTPRLLAE